MDKRGIAIFSPPQHYAVRAAGSNQQGVTCNLPRFPIMERAIEWPVPKLS
jgi:hypothetical protein